MVKLIFFYFLFFFFFPKFGTQAVPENWFKLVSTSS